MAFNRKTAAAKLLQGDALTRAMVGIGMRFAAEGDAQANIEDTLLAASFEGLEREDLRVLAVLTTWLAVHQPWINVDRLTRALSSVDSNRVRAYWSAIASWLGKDRRFARIARLYVGPHINLLRVGTEFQIARNGEDARFANNPLRVPEGVLRYRTADVMTPAELAKHHRSYRYRVLIGPSYRADIWAELEADPTLSASELAHKTYSSFATAWLVKKDFELLAA